MSSYTMLIPALFFLLFSLLSNTQAAHIRTVQPPTATVPTNAEVKGPIPVDHPFWNNADQPIMCFYPSKDDHDHMPDPKVHGEECFRCVNMTRSLFKADFNLGHMRMGLFKINRILCKNLTRHEPLNKCYERIDHVTDEQLIQLYLRYNLAHSSFAVCNMFNFCNAVTIVDQETGEPYRKTDRMGDLRSGALSSLLTISPTTTLITTTTLALLPSLFALFSRA